MSQQYGFCNGASTDFNVAQNELVRNVLKNIEQGWELVGGVTALVVPTVPHVTYIFTQAIVKKDKEGVD
jgi:hypothetical protein